MNIETYGGGGRLYTARRLLSEAKIPGHAVLLPIPSTKDGVTVLGTDIHLTDTLRNLSKGSILIGYGLPPDIIRKAGEMGAQTLSLESDEEFLCENAHVTAVGAIAALLDRLPMVPKDTCFGIIGYGRIGSRLLRMLLSLGGRVKVFTSKEEKRLSLGECGIETDNVISGRAIDTLGLDVIINTAPTRIDLSLSRERAKELLVVELASGNNLEGVEEVLRLPSVPERIYPESGGRAYFNAIMRAYREVSQ